MTQDPESGVLSVAGKAEPKPGDKMTDGSVYAGRSRDTGRPIYTTPEDAPLTYSFKQAAKYAARLNRDNYLGYDDWRVPTEGELGVLFEHRAAIGQFDQSGSDRPRSYWSSLEGGRVYDSIALVQDFSDGSQWWHGESNELSLRCVRG